MSDVKLYFKLYLTFLKNVLKLLIRSFEAVVS